MFCARKIPARRISSTMLAYFAGSRLSRERRARSELGMSFAHAPAELDQRGTRVTGLVTRSDASQRDETYSARAGQR
jgi:hypothetical protein